LKAYSRTMMLCAVICMCIGVVAPRALAAIISESDENADGKSDQWIEDLGGDRIRVAKDRDFNGMVDYAVIFDPNGFKEYEELDFNFDGVMDDFYYYREGVLELRTVDTNFDREIDLWVHVSQGIYMWKIERDRDFDGKMDYVKEYGPPPAKQ